MSALVRDLTVEELRVLGCLIEKEHTTPEQYPLSLNALVAACNQSSNRTPVVDYDEDTVTAAVGLLRERHLVRVVLPGSGSRATKYRHVVDEAWGLTPAECAVLAVLTLRGPQTVNELRVRTERYRGLDALGGVEEVLVRLATRYDEPYVADLGRQPGQREERWTHCLGDQPEIAAPATPAASPRGAPAVEALRAEVADLRAEVAALRQLVEGGTDREGR